MVKSDDNNDQIEPLRQQYNDARERLSQQLSEFSEFAEEGQRMIRITLIYAGLLVTGLSYLSNQGDVLDSSELIKPLLAISTTLILFSLFFHLVGREVRGVKKIYEYNDESDIDPSEVKDTKSYYKQRISQYKERIKTNSEILNVFETNLGIAKALLFLSFGSTAFAFILTIGGYYLLVFIVFSTLISIFVLHQLMKFPNEYYEESIFEGVISILNKIVNSPGWILNKVSNLNKPKNSKENDDSTGDEGNDDSIEDEEEEDKQSETEVGDQ